MSIQKAGVIKSLRYLGIFCALTMGFFSIVATSEDDAADVLGIDTSFNETVTFETGEVTVDKDDEVVAAVDTPFKDCTEIYSVQGLLEAHEDWEDIQEVDLESYSFPEDGQFQVKYKNAWTDPPMTTFTCSVQVIEESDPMDGRTEKYDVETPQYTVTLQQDTYTDWIDLQPSAELIAAVNYFVNNRTATFTVCSHCSVDMGVVQDWGVTTIARFPVQLKGDLL